MRNAQASPTLHEIDAAPRVDAAAARAIAAATSTPSGSRAASCFLADRLGAGEDDRLGHAHGLGQMQPLGRVVGSAIALVLARRRHERNDRRVGAFAHWTTSDCAFGAFGRLRR